MGLVGPNQNPTSPWATGGIEVASGPFPTFQHCFNPSREGFTPPFIPPHGPFWVAPRMGGSLLLPLLGHSVCTFFYTRFGIRLCWILVPIWLHLASQLGAKIQPKSLQEPSKMHPKSHLVFDHFLDGFLVDFGWVFDLHIHQKSTKNQSRGQPNNSTTKVSKNH